MSAPPDPPVDCGAAPEDPWEQGSAARTRVRYARNRRELLWFGLILLLGGTFAVSGLVLVSERFVVRLERGTLDPMVDGLWALTCLGIVAVVVAVARELVRFLRKVVVADALGVQVGRERLGWDDIRSAREGREFRAGSWFYHLELRGRDRRLWVTSSLIRDYPAFRADLLARRPDLQLQLAKD